MDLTKYRKFIAALLGAAATAVTQGLIDGTAAKWVSIAVATVTSLLVFQVQNDPDVDPEAGSVDPGSLALGALLGLAVAYLLWVR